MNYSEKLKDPRWQKKRLEILSRDNFTCQCCGDKDTSLHIHHSKYTGEPWEAPNEDLKTLCEHCHYCIDVESLAEGGIKVTKFKTQQGRSVYCFILSDGIIFSTKEFGSNNLNYGVALCIENVKHLIDFLQQNGY